MYESREKPPDVEACAPPGREAVCKHFPGAQQTTGEGGRIFWNADDWDLPEGVTLETDEGQATVAPSGDYPSLGGVLLTVIGCGAMCSKIQILG